MTENHKVAIDSAEAKEPAKNSAGYLIPAKVRVRPADATFLEQRKNNQKIRGKQLTTRTKRKIHIDGGCNRLSKFQEVLYSDLLEFWEYFELCKCCDHFTGVPNEKHQKQVSDLKQKKENALKSLNQEYKRFQEQDKGKDDDNKDDKDEMMMLFVSTNQVGHKFKNCTGTKDGLYFEMSLSFLKHKGIQFCRCYLDNLRDVQKMNDDEKKQTRRSIVKKYHEANPDAYEKNLKSQRDHHNNIVKNNEQLMEAHREKGRRADQKEERKAKKKLWRQQNKDKCKLYKIKYLSNPENLAKAKERQKEYDQMPFRKLKKSIYGIEHPEKTKAARDKWTAANPEKARENNRFWQEKQRKTEKGQAYIKAYKASTEAHVNDIYRRAKMLQSKKTFNQKDHKDHEEDDDQKDQSTTDEMLTKEEIYELIHQDCFYCGEEINEDLKYHGIDRIDSNVGYTQENSVACCGMCNFMKGDFPFIDFIQYTVNISANYPKELLKIHKTFNVEDLKVCYGEPSVSGTFQAYKSKSSTRAKYLDDGSSHPLSFNLSENEFKALTGDDCYYCGRQCTDGHVNGVDRIDSNDDYTVENCVSCCKICNLIKKSFYVDHFLKTCFTISIRWNSIFAECLETRVKPQDYEVVDVALQIKDKQKCLQKRKHVDSNTGFVSVKKSKV